MNFVQALRRARVLIESGKETYICNAITTVGKFDGTMTQNEHDAYRARIQGILDFGAREWNIGRTYNAWVEVNHPKIYATMTDADFRQGRLQWIDHIIHEELRLAY